MCRKWLILATGGLATVLVLLMCLTLGEVQSPIGFGVDISRQAEGAETLFRASITNRISRPIKLNAKVQVSYLAEDGYELGGDFIRLAGSGTDIGGLLPKGFDSVELRGSGSVRGVRLRFTYSYPADPFRKAVGWGFNKLGFRPRYQSALWWWLRRNGLLGGTFLRTYDETWFLPRSPKGELLPH